MTTTEPRTDTEKLAWVIRVILLTKAGSVIVGGLGLNQVQALALDARLITAALDAIGEELVGERDLTGAEMQMGLDLIDALPDGLHTMGQFVDAFTGQLDRLGGDDDV